MRHLRRIKRVPFAIWYCKHEITHVLIGLIYAWFLRELWMELSLKYIITAIIGSLIIDADHLLYFFVYARHEWYSIEVRKILRQGQIGTLLKFWRDNHKHNTGLLSHNVYFMALFFVLTVISFYFDWNTSIVLSGTILLHLAFDIFDDFWALGHLNENWKHLRRRKQQHPVTNSV